MDDIRIMLLKVKEKEKNYSNYGYNHSSVAELRGERQAYEQILERWAD
jgi:hypothetical protein